MVICIPGLVLVIFGFISGGAGALKKNKDIIVLGAIFSLFGLVMFLPLYFKG